MSSNLDNIQTIISELNLTNEFRLLGAVENKTVFHELENLFVNKNGLRWWWEDFKLPFEISEEIDKPWENINSLVPNTCKKVLLMIEDNSEIYPILHCNPQLIPRVLNECYWFEYYIIDEEYQWLICENHHNAIFTTGTLVNKSNEA